VERAELICRGIRHLTYYCVQNANDYTLLHETANTRHTSTESRNMKHNLVICAIIKNEEHYIKEWLAFNRIVGVEHFYLYDNFSTDRTMDICDSQPDVTAIVWPQAGSEKYACPISCRFEKTPQTTAFNHFCKEYASKTEWCMFTDPDEYLFHTQQDSLPDALGSVPGDASGLVVCWLVFGSGGHRTRPAGLTIENYRTRAVAGGNTWWFCSCKSILRPDQVRFWGPYGSHAPITNGRLVNELGEAPNGGVMVPPRVKYWRCNHYFTRSIEEYGLKATRVDINANPPQSPHCTLENDRNDVEDTMILRFSERLRAELASGRQIAESPSGVLAASVV
jgi:hypothetical protein